MVQGKVLSRLVIKGKAILFADAIVLNDYKACNGWFSKWK